jgi:hypothetical protein
MKRLSTERDELALGLPREAAQNLTNELRVRLQPAIAALESQESGLPDVAPVLIALDGRVLLELTTREALDLYFAFSQLLEESASGTAEHTHVYAEDYGDEFAVWIDPNSTSTARVT